MLAGIAFAVFACNSEPAGPAAARVYFVLDAPLCSSQLPMRFEIDGVLVGVDTFRVNLAPNRTKSRAFSVPAGSRTLGARVDGGFEWPDTTVMLEAGKAFSDTLPFYCS